MYLVASIKEKLNLPKGYPHTCEPFRKEGKGEIAMASSLNKTYIHVCIIQ